MKNNKNVKTEKKKKTLLLWSIFLFLCLFFAIVSFIKIDKINVIGNRMYNKAQIEKMIFTKKYDRNFLVCFIKEKFVKHEKFPFISDYKIQFKSFFECDVVIYEKSVVGCIKYMESYMYFDKDGIIVDSSEKKIVSIPVVNGLEFDSIVLNKKLPVRTENIFRTIMNITQQLSQKEIKCKEINMEKFSDIEMLIDEGEIRVLIGNGDDLAVKISALADMLPEIYEKKLAGTLDLRNYSDDSSENINSFKIESRKNY